MGYTYSLLLFLFIFGIAPLSLQANESYSTLELKAQIDAGEKNLQITIPKENREKIAELMKRINPEEASLLKKTGQVSLKTFNSVITFYLALGISEASKCFLEKDPSACKSYIESLKEPTGHIGFLLFIAFAKIGHTGVEKFFQTILQMSLSKGLEKTSLFVEKYLTQRVASYMGLALGAFANEAFMELYHSPHALAYRDAAKIIDKNDREKKRSEALDKLAEETYANKDWWKDKTPTIASLIAASAATEASMRALHFTLNAGDKFMQKSSLPENCKRAFASLGNTSIVAAKGGLKGFAIKSSAEIGSILVFLSWLSFFEHPAEWAWEKISISPNLEKIRKKIKTLPQNISERELENLFKELDISWEKKRSKQFIDVTKIMSSHRENLNLSDKILKKPYLFYSWLVADLQKTENNETEEWKILKKEYYSPETKPEDIKKETLTYLKSFFCGVDPEKSYINDSNIHGIPVPGKFYPNIKPYRVVKSTDPKLCSTKTNPDILLKTLKEGNFTQELNEAHASSKVVENDFRIKKLEFYEGRVDKKLITILSQKTIPSYEEELKYIEELKKKFSTNEKLNQLIEEKITQTKEKKKAAENLLNYMKTPANSREAPILDINALLGLFNNTELPNWQKSIQYYNGFILE